MSCHGRGYRRRGSVRPSTFLHANGRRYGVGVCSQCQAMASVPAWRDAHRPYRALGGRCGVFRKPDQRHDRLTPIVALVLVTAGLLVVLAHRHSPPAAAYRERDAAVAGPGRGVRLRVLAGGHRRASYHQVHRHWLERARQQSRPVRGRRLGESAQDSKLRAALRRRAIRVPDQQLADQPAQPRQRPARIHQRVAGATSRAKRDWLQSRLNP